MKCALVFFFPLFLFRANGQNLPSEKFSIEINNNSKGKIFCYIPDVFSDSVQPGKFLKITKLVKANSLPNYLFIYLFDQYQNRWAFKENKRIIYKDVNARRITIDPDNKIVFSSNYSEKYLEKFLGDITPENFWEYSGKMITLNANDFASAEIINLKFCNAKFSVDTIKHFYNLLSERVRNSFFGQRVSNYVKGRVSFKEGFLVKEISLKDPSLKIRTLSEIKSKYVLLDFWFSRCGPCLESFPDLIKLYKKTDREKLEIIGISIDNESAIGLWKQTIQENNIPWINLLDPEYSISYGMFSIEIYPTKILLDGNRRILKINPDNTEIENIVNN